MTDIDWSKAPEGYPLWLEYLEEALNADSARRLAGGEWVADKGDRYETTRGTFWSKPSEGFYQIHERPPAWNGAGLPPLGTVCECRDSGGTWRQVKITAIAEKGVCFVDEEGFEIYIQHGDRFRPIRTEAQIAAEDREKAIEQMEPVAAEAWRNCQSGDDMITVICRALYDAGYRKQEPKP